MSSQEKKPFAMSAQAYTGTRVTVHSAQSFEETMEKLYSSIGKPDKAGAWPKIAAGIKSYTEESRKEFISSVEQIIGPHGFMIFQEINHGAWIPLYGVGDGMQSKRIILGNPLIAITMLKHDMTAGLYVPIELLVLQKHDVDGGGVDLIYQLPSGLIASLNDDPELISAAKVLDGKLENLIKAVAGSTSKS